MSAVPPKSIRRVVLCPLAVITGIAAVIASPFLLLAAALIDLVVRKHWRTVRLTALGILFLAYETMGLLALFGLWLASGLGYAIRRPRFRDAHYALMRWWLNGIAGSMERLLALNIDVDRQPPETGPILVFSRHAGPGDSVFLARGIAMDYNRCPRVVAKQDLQLAPFLDVVGHRLPNHFVNPNPDDGTSELAAIGRLATNMRENDAVIIFPEGGNFTRRRRRRAIGSLERRGHAKMADQAREMPNLIAPRPGGALAAIEAAPEADVVFVAHTGTEDLTTLAKIWSNVPMDRTLRAAYWRIKPADIPTDRQDRIDWLFGWWAEIDQWIDANRPQPDVAQR